MTTRSTRLFASSVTTTGTQLLYTGPASTVTLFKSGYLYNPGTVAVDYSLFVTAAGGAANVTVQFANLPASATGIWTGWIVLEPGDQIWLWFNAPPIDVWLSGAILPAAPVMLLATAGELASGPGKPPWVVPPPFKVQPDPQVVISSQ